MRRLFVLLAGVLSFYPFSAQACCSSILSAISGLESSLLAQLRSNAQDANTGLKSIQETVVATEQQSTQAIINALWEIHRRDLERQLLEKRAELYYNGGVPVDLCEGAERAEKVRKAIESSGKAADDLSKKVGDSTKVGGGGDRKAGPEEIKRVLEIVKDPNGKATDVSKTLFSPDASFEEKQTQIELLLTFVPPQDLSESLKKNTSAGMMFQSIAEEYRLRTSAQREVLVEAAKHTTRGENGEKSFSELVSEYLEKESYMSDAWREKISRLNQVELMRELNTQLAFGALLEKRMLDIETKTAVASVSLDAYRLDANFKEMLNARRAQAQAQKE